MHILALNNGSSSLKFGLYRVDATSAAMVVEGDVDGIDHGDGRIAARDAAGRVVLDAAVASTGQREAVERIASLLETRGLPVPDAIGHRIVHGGRRLRRHCVIDEATVSALEAATAFAPLHTPRALELLRCAGARYPDRPQVACLDTAFHATLDERARTLPLPRDLRADGIERYGFHGLSCESIVARLASPPPARVVIAHLGNGASITAVRDGRSFDTSMGLTPTGGVIMGTRSGDLDPGVVLYLMREKKLDAAQLEELLDHRSGLLGLSGTASDLRTLHDRATHDDDASLAIAMFCYSVRKQIAAMIAALDGIDRLVFTGGIGEHDAAVRGAVCDGLRWIGVHLDGARNRTTPGEPLESSTSRCAIRVMTSMEDERIARHTHDLVV